MNRIAIKLALFIFGIILASTIISFAAVSLLSHQVADEIATDQLDMAHAIQALRDRTDLPLNEILDVVSNQNYRVEEGSSLDAVDLDEESVSRLEGDEIVRVGWNRIEGTTTLLRFGDSYVSIRLEPQRNIMQIWFSRLWNTIVLYVVISAALVITLTNKVVRPVLQLTNATQEVARGNFEVRIDSGRNDEIGRLTQNFNHMVGELRTIDYLRRDFISNVSHEFKTPLASIQGYAKLLQNEDVTTQDRREYAAVIAEEAMRLASMSSTMLVLSKLENQQSVEAQTRFSLDEQIRRAIVVLEPQWGKKSIKFDINLVAKDVFGNEELLQQVWINLLGNAIKFSPPQSKIDVTSRLDEERVVVTIRDRGIGIAEEDLPRVFEKFFQVDRTRTGEGSGLGLSLVRRIVTLFGGTIDVESAIGEGATFIVTFPGDRDE